MYQGVARVLRKVDRNEYQALCAPFSGGRAACG
jgi:hypothetical protein